MPARSHTLRRPFRAVSRAGRWCWRLAGAVSARVMDHNATGRSSGFAYNAFLATVPFLFVLVTALGPQVYDRLIADVEDDLPDELRNVLLASLDLASRSTGQAVLFLAIGIIAALFITSNVMSTLMGGLDDAYGVPHRPWVQGRLIALVFAGCLGIIAMLTTMTLVGGSRLIEAGAELVGLAEGAEAVQIARSSVFPIGVLAYAVFVFLLYRFGPNRKRRPPLTWTLPGAAFSVGSWVGVTSLFRLFIETFGSYNAVYGSLAAVVVYLTFLYITGLTLLIGAEMNGELQARRARRTLQAQSQLPPVEAPRSLSAIQPSKGQAPRT